MFFIVWLSGVLNLKKYIKQKISIKIQRTIGMNEGKIGHHHGIYKNYPFDFTKHSHFTTSS